MKSLSPATLATLRAFAADTGPFRVNKQAATDLAAAIGEVLAANEAPAPLEVSTPEFCEWLTREGLPTSVLTCSVNRHGPKAFAAFLMRSPDSLRGAQRAYLAAILAAP